MFNKKKKVMIPFINSQFRLFQQIRKPRYNSVNKTNMSLTVPVTVKSTYDGLAVWLYGTEQIVLKVRFHWSPNVNQTLSRLKKELSLFKSCLDCC